VTPVDRCSRPDLVLHEVSEKQPYMNGGSWTYRHLAAGRRYRLTFAGDTIILQREMFAQ
jgi:hypothetical protein